MKKNKLNYHNLEIEADLLGLLIVDDELIYKVRGYLEPKHFFDEKHQDVYRAILDIHDQGFTIETNLILDNLKTSKNFDSEQQKSFYLAKLIDSSGIKSNLDKYVKEISDHHQRRFLKDSLAQIHEEIDFNKDPEHINTKLQNKLSEAKIVNYKTFENSKEIIDRAIEELEQKRNGFNVSGVSSGWPSLDNLTLGFQNGDLVIIAARPSMGKTAFALNLAKNVAIDKNVAIFSLEMPATQLFNRILSSEAIIKGNKLRDPKFLNRQDLNAIHAARNSIKNLNIFVDDTSSLKLNDLIWKAKHLNKKNKLDLIIIDYLQLISLKETFSENRQFEVSLISSSLKKLARELEIPIIALSQLSRRVEQRESKIPMMSDLRESGAIEQDADQVIFLYRDAYYNREKKELNNQENDYQPTNIIIAKHRNGPTGTVDLLFSPSFSLFKDQQKEG